MPSLLTLDQATLKCWLRYNKRTGNFTWIRKPRGAVQLGDIAGYVAGGYTRVKLFGVKYQAHRLAWLYVTGVWPTNEIDHKNGVRTDNRWTNLRDVTRTVNMQNRRGVKGYRRNIHTFDARIVINGKEVHIGSFKTEAEAHAAYIDRKKRDHEGYVK